MANPSKEMLEWLRAALGANLAADSAAAAKTAPAVKTIDFSDEPEVIVAKAPSGGPGGGDKPFMSLPDGRQYNGKMIYDGNVYTPIDKLKLPAPMLPDCKTVTNKVPGPVNHLLCVTHNHVVDVKDKTIIAHSVAEYIKAHPVQHAAPAGQGKPAGAPPGQAPADNQGAKKPIGTPDGQDPTDFQSAKKPLGTPVGQKPAANPELEQAGYTKAREAAEADLKSQPQPHFKQQDQDWEAIEKILKDADALAESGDFAGAGAKLKQIKPKLADFKKKHDELAKKLGVRKVKVTVIANDYEGTGMDGYKGRVEFRSHGVSVVIGDTTVDDGTAMFEDLLLVSEGTIYFRAISSDKSDGKTKEVRSHAVPYKLKGDSMTFEGNQGSKKGKVSSKKTKGHTDKSGSTKTQKNSTKDTAQNSHKTTGEVGGQIFGIGAKGDYEYDHQNTGETDKENDNETTTDKEDQDGTESSDEMETTVGTDAFPDFKQTA